MDKLLGNFSPKEVLYDRSHKQEFERYFGNRFFTFELDDWVFTDQSARQKLLRHFGVKNMKGFGVDHLHNGIIAAGAILQYLELTQHTQIGHITAISRIEEERYVRLDKFTIRSLELLNPMQDDGSSLLDVIDRTVSPMGGRLLRRWMVFPLKDERPRTGSTWSTISSASQISASASTSSCTVWATSNASYRRWPRDVSRRARSCS